MLDSQKRAARMAQRIYTSCICISQILAFCHICFLSVMSVYRHICRQTHICICLLHTYMGYVMFVKSYSLIQIQLFVTPWTVAHKAPLSLGFSRQEYWSELLCPSPGDLPYPGVEPLSLMSPALAGRFFTSSTT